MLKVLTMIAVAAAVIGLSSCAKDEETTTQGSSMSTRSSSYGK
jgi:hypothetical protein